MTYDRARRRCVLFDGTAARSDLWFYGHPNPGRFQPFGTSCRHSGNVSWGMRAATGSRPVIGKAFRAEIAPLPANPLARPFFFIGGNRLSSPIALCALNACGCNLLLPANLAVPGRASSGGVGSVDLPIPRLYFLVGFDLYLQGAVLGLSKPQQIAVTDGAHLTIGSSKW